MQNSNSTEDTSREADRHVAAVTAALSLLDCFDADTSLRLRDFHERTGMQKSRILRLAGSLAAEGYLVNDKATGGYRLGPKILALGQLVAGNSVGIGERIRPILTALSAELQDTCFFSVVRGVERIVVEQVMPTSGLCFTIPRGQIRPLHAGATGKVLLAFGPEALRTRVLKGRLTALTPGTTTSPEALRGEIERALSQGYLVSRGEATAHAYALAVPVLDPNDGLLGAVTVAGPSSKVAPDDEAALADRLKAALAGLF